MTAFSKNMFESELAEYYDVMHHHRNYGLECQFVDNLIQEYCPGSRHILDIGCGTGEHAIIMARLGYEVTAIDASQNMIDLAGEKAKKAAVSVEFRCVDVLDMRLADRFQAAYCLGYTFHYMTTESCAMSFLKTINKVLLPQGVFLVDILSYGSLMADFPKDKFVFRHGGTAISRSEQASLDNKKGTRHIEFNYIIEHRDGQVKTICAKEDLRIFSNAEVRMLLSNSGFDSITVFGNYDLVADISDDTNVVVFCSCKTNK